MTHLVRLVKEDWVSSKPRFLDLRTSDIVEGILLCGALLCTVGCVIAFWPLPHPDPNNSSLKLHQSKLSPDHSKCALWDKIVPGWEPLL